MAGGFQADTLTPGLPSFRSLQWYLDNQQEAGMEPDLVGEPDASVEDLPPTDTFPTDGSEPSLRNPSMTPDDEEWVPEMIVEGLDEDVEAAPINPSTDVGLSAYVSEED